MYFIVWMSLMCGATMASQTVPPQLNETTFERCIRYNCHGCGGIAGLLGRYNLTLDDGLLLYLSVYPGVRIPFMNRAQTIGFNRWCKAFWPLEQALAAKLVEVATNGTGAITPATIVAGALSAGCRDFFCVGLVSHNVIRTLGRWPEAIEKGGGHNWNPPWFTSQQTTWTTKWIPAINASFVPLEQPQYLVEQFGAYYHFFGLFVFGVHELSVVPSVAEDFELFVVLMDKLLNPILAGGPESPVKYEIDKQSVQIVFRTMLNQTAASSACCLTGQDQCYVMVN